MKVTRKLEGKILNWFVGLGVGKIFPQNMFYSWHAIEQGDAAEL